MKNTHNLATEQNFKEQLRKIDHNMGLSQTADEQTDDTGAGHVETKFGKFQVDSFLSYQVALTKSHLEATASINCIARRNQVNNDALHYPRFPLRDTDSMVLPDNLSENDDKLFQSLTLVEDEINEIETQTRKQAERSKWKEERKFRFTASQFHLISK